MNKNVIFAMVFIILSMSLLSAVTIKSVNYGTFTPGSEGSLSISIENNLDDDIEDVSLSIVMDKTPFSTLGSSEDSVDDIRENDDETFSFTLKASASSKPGDYSIPYTLKYTFENQTKTEQGSFGVTISGSPRLEYSASLETPVLGRQTKMSFKIVNKGFADARFVSISLTPSGYTLISESNSYIGTVSSDDFETADFDVYLNTLNPLFKGVVEYTDFNNKKISEDVQIPLKVYDEKTATELGIIQRSNAPLVMSFIILVILVIVVWRILKKRKMKKKLALQ